MAEFPAFPLWTDAYLGDTTHLTTIEHGAYLLLLFAAWRTPTYDLPDNDRLLAKVCRLSNGQWQRIRPTIMAYWHLKDGRWSNGRLLDERDAVRRKVAQRSDAGKASALKRLNRDSTGDQRNTNESSTSKATPKAIISSYEDIPSQTEAIQIADAMTAYNTIAVQCGWAQAAKLSTARVKALGARIRDCGGITAFRAAMARASASDFLTGRSPRGEGHGGWAPDLDWFLKAKNFNKLMEGSYDNRKSAKRHNSLDSLLAGGASLIADLRAAEDGSAESGEFVEAFDASGDDLRIARLHGGSG